MAKRRDDSKRKNPFLPDPDEYYFDDDLDSVTRNLPTEEEYLPQEEVVPVDEPITEGTNRIGVRMIGLKPTADDYAEEDDDFTPAYDADDEDDLTAPRRTSRPRIQEEPLMEDEPAESAPVMRTKTKKQQRLLQQEKEKAYQATIRAKATWISRLFTICCILIAALITLCLLSVILPNVC